MHKTRIVILVIVVLAVGGTIWWFFKFPQPYGAYSLHGIYVKPSPSLAPENVDALPVYYPFANIIFGKNPNVVASQGDEAYRTAHPDDPTQAIIFTSDTEPGALADEYFQYFKGMGWHPTKEDSIIGAVVIEEKSGPYHLIVTVQPGNPSGSLARIIKTP